MSSAPFSVRGDVRAITHDLDVVARKIVPGVVASSLTGTVREIRKKSLARLKPQFALPARSINRRIAVGRATRRRWEAALFVRTHALNPAKETTVRPIRGGLRAGKLKFERAFVRRYFGRPVILQRKGPNRHPLNVAVLDFRTPAAKTVDALVRRASPIIFRRLFLARLTAALERRGLSSARVRVPVSRSS